MNYLLIGVDGGATEVKAHAVRCTDITAASTFELCDESASRKYPLLSGFKPVPVEEQLAQFRGSRTKLLPVEEKQGDSWIRAAAEVVAEVAAACGERRVLVGMGMPGLKTPDGRGISVINNGPRIPDFLDRFERHVAALGVELVDPVSVLGSDADYCGLGEQYATDGLFRGVENAYYIGCGTGIADAFKLHGRLIPFDSAHAWIQKAWQVPSALGPTFETIVSARGMNTVYARLLDGELRHPEADAADGRPLAITWMDTVALLLAEIICERLDTVENGRRAVAHRGEDYCRLQAEHPFRGTVLDRVVIGQRLGQIYADRRYHPVFAAKLDAHVAGMIIGLGDHLLIDRCLDESKLKPGFVCASSLRAAPALGAAIAAAQAYGRR